MDNQQFVNMTERRSGADRRDTDQSYDFPFIDSHGQLVTEERRKFARRVEERPQDKYNSNVKPSLSSLHR